MTVEAGLKSETPVPDTGVKPTAEGRGRRGHAWAWRARRALTLVGTLLLVIWGSSVLAFLVLNAMPGDPVAGLLGVNATPEAVEQMRAQLHLDDPLWTRYLDWVSAAVQGDLGVSISSRAPVNELIANRLPATLELFVLALLLSVVLAYAVALPSAAFPGSILDRCLSWITTAFLALSDFVVALLLVFVFAVTWALLPSLGYVPFSENPVENLRAMILPAFALAAPRFAINARVLRAELISRIAISDHALAARAKGMSQFQVMMRHGLKNGSFTLMPIIGAGIPKLLGGTVILEPIFAIPGMGSLLLQAVQSRDAPTVQGVVLVFAIMTVLSAFAAERLGVWLDPRISEGRSG